jgi:hypothetical protein
MREMNRHEPTDFHQSFLSQKLSGHGLLRPSVVRPYFRPPSCDGLRPPCVCRGVSGVLTDNVGVGGPKRETGADGAANQQCSEQIPNETTVKHGHPCMEARSPTSRRSKAQCRAC